MKDVYAVLRQKEIEQSRLEKEVEALRVAAPLLSEDGELENDNERDEKYRSPANDSEQPLFLGVTWFVVQPVHGIDSRRRPA
jgi:hypothetical protein